MPAADEQQALQNVKLEGVAGVAGRVLVLLAVLLTQPSLQHGNDLKRGLGQRREECNSVVQDDGAYAVEVQDDGTSSGQDGGGAAELAVNDADVAPSEPALHLQRAAIEIALLNATVGENDGGVQRALL